MKARLNAYQKAPATMKAAADLAANIKAGFGLEPRFIHLIDLRASQINGCAYCVDMHCKEARADGLSQQWIDLVSVWRESPLYDARERAVLEWTEAVTRVEQTGAPDAAFEALKPLFSEEEIIGLTTQIAMINFWNRVAISMRSQHPVERKAA
ncbi:carboxymuconolactone decarboxylase family protein [Paracoccus sulfuroxidans]|uniref:AhpD family alkylhydroperoxidase n=1 Tax=Paracoccus sulfuroxidans TaxID=384678 RepID=A0A562NQE9_9RHOB|nr:carboxymuconolactone decarboxylase family protein [Paracoccus sulfuroxidans]TWI34427.1 AhpD family alkylhydroperoxidase [Paracoccus sulfuroxidans]